MPIRGFREAFQENDTCLALYLCMGSMNKCHLRAGAKQSFRFHSGTLALKTENLLKLPVVFCKTQKQILLKPPLYSRLGPQTQGRPCLHVATAAETKRGVSLAFN